MHELSFPAAITLPITDTLASIPSRRAAAVPEQPDVCPAHRQRLD